MNPPLPAALALGEVAEVVATGQRVFPKRPLALGYAYHFPDLDAALANLLA